MSPRAAGQRASAWRTANAAIAGLVAGVCGVVIARAALGPGVVVAGAVIGSGAVVIGVSLSWGLSAPHRHRRRPGPVDARHLRRRTHPVAWLGPVSGGAIAVLAWAGVAHSSGSGWVQAVGAVLAAVLLTGMVAPAFPARRASVRCLAAPTDADAGSPVLVDLVANGPLRIRPRHPVGPAVRAVGPHRGTRRAVLEVRPDRRGVLEEIDVELASCAPFGLLWWAREVRVALPRPLHVAPRVGEPAPAGNAPSDPAGDARLRVPAGTGEPRGVRPYQPGDSRRSVHWAATSHVGALMVREKERQTDDPVVVDLVLPPDPAAAEVEAERTMASVAHYLARGQQVLLGTREPQGRVMRPVRDRIDLGRRLARAVPAPPSGP